MKKGLALLLVSFIAFNSIKAQSVVFEKCGEPPVIGEYEKMVPVYDSKTGGFVSQPYKVKNSIQLLAVNSKGVLIGVRPPQSNFISSYLFRSYDHGKNWQDIAGKLPKDYGIPGVISVTSIFAIDSVFFVVDGVNGGTQTIFRSKDNGSTWEALINTTDVQFIGEWNGYCNTKRQNTILLHLGHKVYESTDLGTTWNEVPLRYETSFLPDRNILTTSLNRPLYWLDEDQRQLVSEAEWDASHSGLEAFSSAHGYHVHDPIFIQKNTYVGRAKPSESSYTRSNPGAAKPDIALTKDSGQVWKVLATDTEIEDLLFADCSGAIYGSSYKKPSGINYFRSKNLGKTWEKLAGIPDSFSFVFHTIGNDGRIYLFNEDAMYRSIEPICCTSSNGSAVPLPDYGTTVITHGMMPPGGVYSEKYDTWTKRMGTAILEKAGLGNLYLYNPNSGKLDLVASRGDQPKDGEQIVLFDWSAGSLDPDPRAAELAAEELFLALTFSEGLPLDAVHFIGEGRGCLVNTLALARFEQLQETNPLTVDQVTLLEPVEYSDGAPQIKIWGTYYSELYKGEFERTSFPENVARFILAELISEGAGRIDKAYGHKAPVVSRMVGETDRFVGDLLGSTTDLSIIQVLESIEDVFDAMGKGDVRFAKRLFLLRLLFVAYDFSLQYDDFKNTGPIIDYPNARNFELAPVSGLSLPDGYTKTIKESEFGKSSKDYGGYALSRLNGGTSGRTIIGGSPVPNYDLEKMGILNGTMKKAAVQFNSNYFEIPGWGIMNGVVDDKAVLLDDAVFLHTPFYVPEAATAITVVARGNGNVSKGRLMIDLLNADMQIVKTGLFLIKHDYESPISLSIDLDPAVRKSVCQLSISFTGEAFQDDKGPAGMLIERVYLTSNPPPNTIPGSSNTSTQELKVEEVNESPQGQFQNGTFDSLTGWTFSGGTLELIKGAGALKPDEKKQPMVLRSGKLQLPADAGTLSFNMNKESVIKGDFIVKIRAYPGGKTEVVYEDQIRLSVFDKLNKEAEKLDKVLDDLDPEVYKRSFESISVDISKFSGKEISLEFEYTPLGDGRPRLLLDDVEVN
ncbi:MAG: hypothetical protein R2792_09855 [Saprospiraceae bacterium]